MAHMTVNQLLDAFNGGKLKGCVVEHDSITESERGEMKVILEIAPDAKTGALLFSIERSAMFGKYVGSGLMLLSQKKVRGKYPLKISVDTQDGTGNTVTSIVITGRKFGKLVLTPS